MNKKYEYKDIVKLPVKKVVWMDATSRTDVKITDLNKHPIDLNLLTERTTIGWVFKEDKERIILIHDITSDGDIELTTIPKGWVVL